MRPTRTPVCITPQKKRQKPSEDEEEEGLHHPSQKEAKLEEVEPEDDERGGEGNQDVSSLIEASNGGPAIEDPGGSVHPMRSNIIEEEMVKQEDFTSLQRASKGEDLNPPKESKSPSSTFPGG